MLSVVLTLPSVGPGSPGWHLRWETLAFCQYQVGVRAGPKGLMPIFVSPLMLPVLALPKPLGPGSELYKNVLAAQAPRRTDGQQRITLGSLPHPLCHQCPSSLSRP